MLIIKASKISFIALKVYFASWRSKSYELIILKYLEIFNKDDNIYYSAAQKFNRRTNEYFIWQGGLSGNDYKVFQYFQNCTFRIVKGIIMPNIQIWNRKDNINMLNLTIRAIRYGRLKSKKAWFLKILTYKSANSHYRGGQLSFSRMNKTFTRKIRFLNN